MHRLARLSAFVLAALLVTPSVARADDDPTEGATVVTEKDFATWKKLRDADALLSAREFRWRAKADKMKQAKAEQQKAWKESGWDQEKFSTIGSALQDTAQYLEQEAAGGEEAASAKESLQYVHKTTLATARAHRKEITENVSQRMEEEVAAADKAEREGRPPKASELQGTWAIDMDATIEAIGGGIFDAAQKEKTKKDMLAASGDAQYTFSGDRIEVKTVKAGKTTVEKGTWRLDGSQVLFKAEGSKREHSLDVGMLNDKTLAMGRGFARLIFRKK